MSAAIVNPYEAKTSLSRLVERTTRYVRKMFFVICPFVVIAGLDPAIHARAMGRRRLIETWMPGSSPAMPICNGCADTVRSEQ
jgi:hypothetical protein